MQAHFQTMLCESRGMLSSSRKSPRSTCTVQQAQQQCPKKSLLSRFRRLALPLRWLVAPVGASLKMLISRMDFLGNCSVRHSPFDSLWEQGKVSLQRRAQSAGCTRFKHSPMALPTVHVISLHVICRTVHSRRSSPGRTFTCWLPQCRLRGRLAAGMRAPRCDCK